MDINSFPEYYGLVAEVLNRLNIPSPHEDELQEAYFIYHKCVENYDPSLSKFSTYYYQELKYHFRSVLRKAKHREQLLKKIMVLYPSSHIDHYFLQPPLDEREAQIYHFSMEGYSTSDIASLLSISKSTVLRERKKLQRKFSTYVSTPSD
ncbi:sigma-70 family RNA polymerase sigma factor [Salimicrobium flavidum]|uniref:RNA polymerase sigma factor SigS n=1 Tax=Salimicrobium flavidum TaxID=570947 RepID=A0A1N7J093_9BACI|nr:sigma-70 family RNA polymerase sigma factor [Salimicrobium flavidum]SIS42802.1 DNA-directed RNA polymerase specialized sigma subunit, sigma24 family [Salimicrobium flavidum]